MKMKIWYLVFPKMNIGQEIPLLSYAMVDPLHDPQPVKPRGPQVPVYSLHPLATEPISLHPTPWH